MTAGEITANTTIVMKIKVSPCIFSKFLIVDDLTFWEEDDTEETWLTGDSAKLLFYRIVTDCMISVANL